MLPTREPILITLDPISIGVDVVLVKKALSQPEMLQVEYVAGVVVLSKQVQVVPTGAFAAGVPFAVHELSGSEVQYKFS